MITPEYLNEVIQGVELAVNRLNNQLLKEVVKKIVEAFYTGRDILMPSTIHKLHQIVQSGYTLDEIRKTIEDALPDISSEIHKAFLESANTIAAYNYEFSKLMIHEYNINRQIPEYTFENIPRSAKALNMTRMEIMKLENAYKRTNGTVRNMTKTTAISVQNEYVQACDDIYMKSQAGVPVQQAVNDVVGDIAKRGITTVEYPTGHTDKIDVAILDFNAELCNLSVGLKQLSQNPWEAFAEDFKVGSIHEGSVVKKTQKGFFVRVEHDLECFVSKLHMPKDSSVKVGDQIEIRVIEFSAVNCKLSGCHKDVHVDIKTQKNNVFSEGFMRKGNFITKTSARFGDIDELIDLSKKLKSKEE